MATNNAVLDTTTAPEEELGLDIQFLAGNAAAFEAGTDSEDCTSDGCGSTPFAGDN